MNFCSIEDAWGKQNYISNQLTSYNNNCETHIEKFVDAKKSEIKKPATCEEFLEHLKNCSSCYNKVKSQFKPKLVEKFEEMVDDNKDAIVLVLSGVSLLLFINLVNNITKN